MRSVVTVAVIVERMGFTNAARSETLLHISSFEIILLKQIEVVTFCPLNTDFKASSFV